AGLDCGGNRVALADAHDAPGADVKTLARLVHVDHAASEVERVRAFVDEDRIGTVLDGFADDAQRAVVIHRRVVVHQLRRHLGDDEAASDSGATAAPARSAPKKTA